jgi:hypothetical protein
MKIYLVLLRRLPIWGVIGLNEQFHNNDEYHHFGLKIAIIDPYFDGKTYMEPINT